MTQGGGFRSICFPMLLIALAVQGITPDAHDLASLSLLRMLLPPRAAARFPMNGPAPRTSTVLPDGSTRPIVVAPPSSAQSSDGTPDEVCAPAQSPTQGPQTQGHAGGRPDQSGLLIPSQVARLARVGRILPTMSPMLARPGSGLILTLCRLVC